MRDGRRVRDKFEFSLEPKQLALLFVLCLVILILVFALGIIVGRGVQQPDVMPEEVAMVGEPAVAADAPPVEPAPIPEPKKEKAEAKPGDEKPAPKLKFFDADGGEPKKVVEAKPAAAQKEAKPAKPTATKTEPAEKKKAVEKKPAPKQASTKETKVAKAASTGKTYTIQVSAFQNRAQAEHMVANLKHKGYEAYIARASIPGKGVWFRVRIGEFGTRSAAQTTANKLKRKEGISTYVTLRQ